MTLQAFPSVPLANAHTLTITAPGNAVLGTMEVRPAGATYEYKIHPNQTTQTLTWELRGLYKVPGTTNTWTGKPLSGTVRCTL